MTERPLSEIKYLVIHHTVTPEDYTVDDIRNIHLTRGYSDVGYHYLVNRAGIHPGRDRAYVGAHAATEKVPYKGWSMNRMGIGIALIGNFEKNAPDDKLINELAFAVKTLAKKFGLEISRKTVIPHSAVSYTACPGVSVMEKLYRKLGI